MLKKRITTAALLILLLGFALFSHKLILLSLVLIIYLILQFELYSFCKQLDEKSKIILTFFSLILPAAYGQGGFSYFFIASCFYFIISAFYLILYLEKQTHELLSVEVLNILSLSVAYIGIMGTCLFIVASRFEVPYLIWLISIPVVTDSAAYFAGTYLGKNKLAPRISPAKTWEGFFAGVFAALILGIVVSYFKLLPIHYFLIILASLTMSLFAVIGDLFESLIKRCYNVKDSGKILPGHGGLMDRLDALLFASPVLLVLEFFLN